MMMSDFCEVGLAGPGTLYRILGGKSADIKPRVFTLQRQHLKSSEGGISRMITRNIQSENVGLKCKNLLG